MLSALVHPEKHQDPKAGNVRYNDGARIKLVRWFWAATFTAHKPTNLSDERDAIRAWAESRSDEDAPEVVRSVRPPDPRQIESWRFRSWEHVAVTALLARHDPHDLLTGERIAAEQAFRGHIDGHHLFPKGWARTHGVSVGEVDVVVNSAAITGYTNRWIGNRAPSQYLAALTERIGADRLTQLLEQHLAPEEPMTHDDWPTFRAQRAERIHALIAAALEGRETPLTTPALSRS